MSRLGRWAAGWVVAMLAAAVMADDYSEDFDDWGTLSFGNYTNNDWRIHDGGVHVSERAVLRESSYVQSPLLTNGIGTVTWGTCNYQAGSLIHELWISTNGTDWTSASTHTNTTFHTSGNNLTVNETVVDSYTPGYARFIFTDDSGGGSIKYLFADDIVIQRPPSYLAISNLTLNPDPQVVDSPVSVSLTIEPFAGADNIQPRLYYRAGDGAFTALNLTPAGGHWYQTLGFGIPAQSVPGTEIDYYIRITFTGPQGTTTNYLPEGAPASYNSYLVRTAPLNSVYPDMTIVGPPTTNMLLTADSAWQGFITPTAPFVNPDFYFASGASTWGDTDQAVFALPVYGEAESGGTISVNQTVTNHLVFALNETNLQYSIQNCAYEDFEGWGVGTTTYGTHTNDEGWVIVNGRMNDSGETGRAFRGKFGILKYDQGASQSVRSPYRSQGIGAVSLRHRSWREDGTEPAALKIQKSATGAGDWITVLEVTNTLSVDYLYVSVPVGDVASHYIRILNDASGSDSWLCLDDVTVTDPGAIVVLSNPGRDPFEPGVGEFAHVWVDTAPQGGATNLYGYVYYRYADETNYSWVGMTVSNNALHGYIPPTLPGSVEYYFQCLYDGFQAAPATYPAEGADDPLVYTNIGTGPGSDRREDFSTWGTKGFGNYTNGYWILHDTGVRQQKALLREEGYILSSFLPLGIGTIAWGACNMSDGDLTFEVRISTNGTDWTTAAVYTNASYEFNGNDPTPYLLELTDYRDLYVRFVLTDASLGGTYPYLYIDDIVITYPPADVAIADVGYVPGYPARHENVEISCTITSVNPNFPAYGLAPELWYRSDADWVWHSLPMSWQGSDVFAATAPPNPAGMVDYYVRCPFFGYHHEEGEYTEDKSPAFSPDAVETNVRPATFHSYHVRYYASDYYGLAITGNFEEADMRLVEDRVWRGVVSVSPTNVLRLRVLGRRRINRSTDDPETNAWGDSRQWLVRVPSVGTLDRGGTNIVLHGDFSGQYMLNVDLETGEYIVQRCDWQDFNEWFLNPDLFADSSRGRDSTNWHQNFDSWAVNSDAHDSLDFEGPYWTNQTAYFYQLDEDGWVVNDARIVNTVDHRCEFRPEAAEGQIRQAEVVLLDGAGDIQFSYRGRDLDLHPTIYTNGYGWTNYQVTVQMQGLGSNQDNDCYRSVFYRYTDPNNFYEYRLVAIDQNRLQLRMYKREGGGARQWLWGSGYIWWNTLDQPLNMQLRVTNQGGSQVRHEFWWGNWWYLGGYTDATGLTSPGTIGFDSYDVNTLVNWVSVDLDSDWVWEYGEDFLSSSPSGWPTDGDWTASGGYYRRVGRTGGTVGFKVTTVEPPYLNMGPSYRTTYRNFASVTNLDYRPVTVTIHEPKVVYTILEHTDGDHNLRFDDIDVSSWRAKTNQYGSGNAAWIGMDSWVTETGAYGGNGRSLELRASRSVYTTTTNQYLRTCKLTTVGPLSFKYKTLDAPCDIALQWADELTPTVYETLRTDRLDSDGHWLSYSFPLNITGNGYIRIAHLSSNLAARFFVDEIKIYDYHEGDTNSWIVYNSLLTDNQSDKLFRDEGQTCYLNYTSNVDTLYGRTYTNYSPYAQTPYLPNGIGEISFWYRKWAVGGPAGLLNIEVSPDGSIGSWRSIFSMSVTNDVYERLVLSRHDRTNRFVRISNTTGGGLPARMCLDDVLVVDPLATDLTITNVVTVPQVPLYTNTVKIRADLTEYILDPTDVDVRAFYHFDTDDWATWEESSGLAMTLINTDTQHVPTVYTYETVGHLDAESIDRVVQYVVRATFDGRQFAEKNSPRRFKDQFQIPSWYEPADYNDPEWYGDGSNRTPYYVVFSCPTGSVWINEVNAMRATYPWGEEEYVELCGRADADIEGWCLRFLETDYSMHSRYLITNNPVFQDEHNGFGFWVLGDDVPEIAADQVFTNAEGNYGMNMPYPQGGIELVRSMGAVEHAVSYGTAFGHAGAQAMEGFEYIGKDLYYLESPLALTNNGTAYHDFTWCNNSGLYTPGAVNAYQTFYGNGPPPEITIYITDMWKDATNVWLVFESSYTNLTARPWYATNLGAPSPWYAIGSYGTTQALNIYTQWFGVLTNAPAYYYRVTGATNGP